MRKRVESGGVTVQAVAGTRAVFLGLDLDATARDGCLGFALHRSMKGQPDPGKWLAGFKTFKSVVPAPDPTTIYRTNDHPLQSFYWGDYTARPGQTYTYRVVPRYGTPPALTNEPDVEASIEITTGDPDTGTHGVYFNRGVAASQAYVREFGDPPDQITDPQKKQEALAWLSRGLLEAILGFIGQASSDRFALRAAFYEFTQPDVLKALQSAHADHGADVQIVYHDLADTTGGPNDQAITDNGVDRAILIRRQKATLAHNKFIVLCTKDAAGTLTPVSVWTGSTNISEGGIFGHSNVGHAVRDPEVASRYLDFWTQLAGDPELDALRDWCSQNSAFDETHVATDGIHTLFSPRHGLAPLRWYAQQFGSGRGGGQLTSAHITEAFGMNVEFEQTLEAYTGDGFHYVMLDQPDSNQDTWGKGIRVIVAVGTEGGPDVLSRWAKESLTGFNVHVPYLHTKVLLVDPLEATPTVITGSANFSPASTSSNDENMLVIQNDPEVADVYFTEFARIFEHFYARYWAARLAKGGQPSDDHSFLSEDATWQDPYFADGHLKCLLRTLYSSQVQGNV
jgi:phosphatidylserine/phosphatidylglycerophosphate/cardiolipin synthase-like enzyme